MATGNNSHKPFKSCPSCRGKGKIKCPVCKGNGRPYDCGYCLEKNNGQLWGKIDCPNCKGTARVKRN